MSLSHFVLSPLFPPSRFGGIEKIVDGLCRALVATGDRVVVLTGGGTGAARQLTIEERDGLRILRVNAMPGDPERDPFVPLLDHVLADGSLRIAEGRLVVHAHDWFVTRVAGRIVRELGAPLLAFFHGDKSSEYGAPLKGRYELIHRLQQELADQADAVICYSSFMQDCIASSLAVDPTAVTLFKCGGDEVATTRNAVADVAPSILYLGRLAPEKDVATLIDAFDLLRDRVPVAQLRIVGSGSTEAALRKQVEVLNLSEHVAFRPFTSDTDEVEKEFRAADVLVLPSTFEPLGMVVLEAMVRELPVVAARAGGPCELIDDGVTGWLFPPGDSVALADCLYYSLADRARMVMIGRAAREYVLREHRWQVAAERVREVAIRVLGPASLTAQGDK